MGKYGPAIGLSFGAATTIFGTIMIVLCVQNVYILHDVIHGATFPPYEWQNFITHPLADFVSLPWMDIIMEHNRHHNSTFDLLNHGEFGWDPASWLYILQEWTFEWYGWLTVPLVPFWHFAGASDTGMLFAFLWWNEFLASDPDRTWPRVHATMAFILGGRHRWNEMLFHDVHHMCPGRIGAMSQRGRFHGWEKVHDACVEI